MSLVYKLESNKKRTNCICTCKEQIWLGFAECIQIRNHQSGELIHEIDKTAFDLCYSTNGEIWAVSTDRLLIINGEVRKFSKFRHFSVFLIFFFF